MKWNHCRNWLSAILVAAGLTAAGAENETRTLDTPRTFPEIHSRKEWTQRALEIREHVLVSCGLWPLPQKTPLQAKVYDRLERDGYSIEKVVFQTYPGFYLAGNLYRPLGKGTGPFPAILNPHGHWGQGRMADQPEGSIAARCINFAKQGMVAFSYDMVGYNDTAQVSHKFAQNPTNQLWNISLMGLQTWNSIRALDFLETLPDVDKTKLACTGESGGGTQTFMLGSIENRLAVQAPIVMVSHTMQGGCLCENAPGLRVEYSNMEIAAAPAPRPQILVAATGDWTRDTMTVEGPSIQKIYDLFNARDQFRFQIFNFGHNYNKTSREAVYEWFGKQLLNHSKPYLLKEQAYQKDPDSALRLFPSGKATDDAMDEPRVIAYLIQLAKNQLDSTWPHDAASLRKFQDIYRTAWVHDFQLESEGTPAAPLAGGEWTGGKESYRTLYYSSALAQPVGREWKGKPGKPVVLLLQSGSASTPADFLNRGLAVAELNLSEVPDRNQFDKFFSTYNRTEAQLHLREIRSAVEFLRKESPNRKIILVGTHDSRPHSGLWALMAAPLVDAVAADCENLDLSSDQTLMAQPYFVPGFNRLGGFQGTALLAGPHPLWLAAVDANFPIQKLQQAYDRLGAGKRLEASKASPRMADVADWCSRIRW